MPHVNRFCIVCTVILLAAPAPALAGAYDACAEPEQEIQGLDFDLKDTRKTLERLRAQHKAYATTKGEEANAKRTKGEIDRFEKQEKEFADQLEKYQAAYDRTCK